MQALWRWLLAVVACSSHIAASHHSQDQAYFRTTTKKPSDTRPDLGETGSLIFGSVNGLLKEWPNVRHRNGHTIVAATVAPGTVLYHGRTDSNVPTVPEWLALDPEYSVLLCVGVCHLLTMVTTRELRLVYFDGNSAAKLAGGTLDTQDLLIWGEVDDNDRWEEEARIQDLCAWGKTYGIDGFVRLSADFEMMACDFSNGLQVVSNRQIMPYSKTHMSIPGREHMDPKLPVGWKGSVRSVPSTVFALIDAGFWHNQSPGETRIRVDYSHMFTFYDPAFTSLVAMRKNQTRDKYRVANISAEDKKAALAQVAEMFTRGDDGSGIDWGSITQVVVDRYSGRLQLVRHLLEHPGSRNVTAQVAEVRAQILTMLTPYMLTDVIPESISGSRSWIAPIAEHCASTLTSWTPVGLLTRQEKLIKDAIDQVLGEICRVVSDIWVDAFGVEEASIDEASRLVEKWRRDTKDLIAWLDWPTWDTCDPVCGPEEICYRPMWPWVPGGIGSYPPDPKGTTPRCILRVEPFAPFLDM